MVSTLDMPKRPRSPAASLAKLSSGYRKVATILEELHIPYNWSVIEFSKVKEEAYLKITPNGRLPAIQDPNTGVTLWEVSFRDNFHGL